MGYTKNEFSQMIFYLQFNGGYSQSAINQNTETAVKEPQWPDSLSINGNEKDRISKPLWFVELKAGVKYCLHEKLDWYNDIGFIPLQQKASESSSKAINGTVTDKNLFTTTNANIRYIFSQDGTFPVISGFNREHSLNKKFGFAFTSTFATTNDGVQPLLGIQLLLSKFDFSYTQKRLGGGEPGLNRNGDYYRFGFAPIGGFQYKFSNKIDFIASLSYQIYKKIDKEMEVLNYNNLQFTRSKISVSPRYWVFNAGVRYVL